MPGSHPSLTMSNFLCMSLDNLVVDDNSPISHTVLFIYATRYEMFEGSLHTFLTFISLISQLAFCPQICILPQAVVHHSDHPNITLLYTWLPNPPQMSYCLHINYYNYNDQYVNQPKKKSIIVFIFALYLSYLCYTVWNGLW